MPSDTRHLLPVSRAARLVNVSRGEIQRRIRNGDIATFEGMVEIEALARAYPDADFEYSSEIERVRRIKDKAFGKRVLERIMPDTEVLLARVDQLGADLILMQQRLAGCRNQADRALQLLGALELDAEQAKQLTQVETLLSDMGASALADLPEVQRFSQANMVLRLMAPHIRLLPSEHEFSVEGNDSILEAGLREGLAINYGCSNGNCGLCKARVLFGEARQVAHTDYVMSEQERAEGYILMCSSAPVTDMVIEAVEAASVEDLPVQTIQTRVRNVQPLSGAITLLHLQTPRTNRLRFFAGQQVHLQLGGQRLLAPVASCPCDDRNLQFHLQGHPGVSKGEQVEVVGPEGGFVLDEESDLPLVFVAAGSGFAPIKSLVEHALAQEDGRDVYVYRSYRGERPYLENQCRMWADALDNVHYIAVEGGDGELLERVIRDHPDGQRRQFYLAGPDGLVTVAQKRLGHLQGFRSYVVAG